MIFDRISTLCEENHITIAALERACSFGNATIRSWRTSSPGVDKLKSVADYFGVTIDELLREPEKEGT